MYIDNISILHTNELIRNEVRPYLRFYSTSKNVIKSSPTPTPFP